MSSEQRRPYRMAKRQDDVDETRQRIVEAAVDLHSSVGPAQTTVAAVAARAGVQRSTVYRHFPDDDTLFAACLGHWFSLNPLPDPGRWAETPDPARRSATALGQLYAYYDANRGTFRNAIRDRDVMPAFVVAARLAWLEEMRRVLSLGWRARGRRRSKLQAAIALAVDFGTSESLAEAGLSPGEASELMSDLLQCVAARSNVADTEC